MAYLSTVYVMEIYNRVKFIYRQLFFLPNPTPQPPPLADISLPVGKVPAKLIFWDVKTF